MKNRVDVRGVDDVDDDDADAIDDKHDHVSVAKDDNDYADDIDLDLREDALSHAQAAHARASHLVR